MTTEVLDGEGKSIGSSGCRTLKWRDSAGRIRDEELFSEIPSVIAGIPNEITAVDTVQHCQFTWHAPVTREQDRVTVVNCGSLEEGRTDDRLRRHRTGPKPEITHEQLGTMVRTTTTTPLGKRTTQGLEVVGITKRSARAGTMFNRYIQSLNPRGGRRVPKLVPRAGVRRRTC